MPTNNISGTGGSHRVTPATPDSTGASGGKPASPAPASSSLQHDGGLTARGGSTDSARAPRQRNLPSDTGGPSMYPPPSRPAPPLPATAMAKHEPKPELDTDTRSLMDMMKQQSLNDTALRKASTAALDAQTLNQAETTLAETRAKAVKSALDALKNSA